MQSTVILNTITYTCTNSYIAQSENKPQTYIMALVSLAREA